MGKRGFDLHNISEFAMGEAVRTLVKKILLIPSTLREIDRNLLTNMCLAQQPLSTGEIEKNKFGVEVPYKINSAYHTINATLRRLEKAGYISRKTDVVKERTFNLWYVNPYFLNAWINKRREIFLEIAKVPKEERENLYPAATLKFFDIH